MKLINDRLLPPTRRRVLAGAAAVLSRPVIADTADMVSVNGRSYRKPARPTIAICVDGFDPAYLQQGLKDGILPNLGRVRRARALAPPRAA